MYLYNMSKAVFVDLTFMLEYYDVAIHAYVEDSDPRLYIYGKKEGFIRHSVNAFVGRAADLRYTCYTPEAILYLYLKE